MVQDILTNPWTISSIITFIFTLGVTYATLNNRIKTLEKELEAIKKLDLPVKIGKIMTDLDWIKTKMDERSKMF